MPVYEYTCEDCQATTEAMRPMANADDPIACEHCGGQNTRRALSVFMARGRASNDSPPLPIGGCGRCGDPAGPCGM